MKPLSGVRIVSIEQFGAGPYGTMLLADLGAEVIKVENAAIGGDPARKTGPYFLGDNDSEYFQVFNLNKKSVALDLSTKDGRAALLELAMTADALMNNLRGDLPAKMGLDYASLEKHKPSIVCVHLSAYGRDNSRASWPGYDYLMQAESGRRRGSARLPWSISRPGLPQRLVFWRQSSRPGRQEKGATWTRACSTLRFISWDMQQPGISMTGCI
jgi:crotonobetainyl-CoA:carnitine CoA-transferase CaiB-like acyl-CoA transferase